MWQRIHASARAGVGATRLLSVLLGLLLGLVTGCAGPAPTPTPTTPTSAASAPASATAGPTGAPPSLDAALAQAVEAHLAKGPAELDNVRAVLVSVDGTPRLAHYRHGFGPATHEHVWSVTKSVLSTLIGQAIGDGLISGLDAPLSELLPSYRSAMNQGTAAVTLRQLLTMAGGFVNDFPEDVAARFDDAGFDAVRWALSEGRVNPAGGFDYSNVGAQVLAGVLHAAVQRADDPDQRSILGYARANLFAPLGIVTEPAYSASGSVPNPDFQSAGFGWARLGEVEFGGYGLRLTPEDMLKIGQLYLDDGVWQGRRVLPDGWAAQVRTPSESAADYGLMWWLSDAFGVSTFAALGAESQHIVIAPERRAVIVILCQTGTDNPAGVDSLDPLIGKVILPALQ